ncbi:MAG: GNAT family N-acetyltransferase [Hamadaea sp.]|nr:GNAT family N-acetyltransferase [Hamadaea sp.]
MIIRPGGSADLAAVRGVFARAARAAYTSILTPQQLYAMTADWRELEPTHRLLVADTGDAVVGFVYVGPGERPGLGYVFDLFVDPPWHAFGVAASLMEAAHGAMTELGITERLLWVLDGNDRAAAFYRRHGWTHDGTRVMSSRGVERLRYRHALV